MTQNSKFNLLDEPWVYVTFGDGKRQMLSLQECFSHACEIRRLSFGQDAVSFAVLRVMVAIMQRTLYVASAANRGGMRRLGNTPIKTLMKPWDW